MIDFGIFTIDGVKRFLFDALRIGGCEFGDMQLRFRSDEVGTYADVRERLGESLAPDDLLLHLRHVTANTDGCASIRESGILGIGDVLSRPSALTRLFEGCGVHFDKASRTVSVDGRRLSLDLVDDAFLGRESSEPIDGLLYILAEDSLVNSFIHKSCIREYSTLSRYPEAIWALEEVVGHGNEAVWRWKDAARPYVVEFTATLKELDLCRLQPDDGMGFCRAAV